MILKVLRKRTLAALEKNGKMGSDDFQTPQSHKAIKSNSIINLPLWDKTGWQGVLYAHYGTEDQQPRMLGLVLSDREVATAVSKKWNNKFGRKNVDD